MAVRYDDIAEGEDATPASINDRLNALRKGDVFNVKSYGAVGDGTTNDGPSINTALVAAMAVGGTLFFPPGTYIVDQEFYVTSAVSIQGTRGSVVKLKSSSAMFNDYTNPYGRYIFHIRASNVTIKDIYFDGNSRNNSYDSGGTTYYNGGGRSVGIMIVGWYNAAASADMADIEISGCTFYDGCASGLDSYMQGFTYVIRRYSVHDCIFWYTQGVQLVCSNCEDSIFYGNRHYQAYFCPFQFYYSAVNCTYDNNTIRFNSSTIDIAKVDPGLKSGSTMTQGSAVRLGKDSGHPNYGCTFSNNKLYGARVSLLSGIHYFDVKNNYVYKSETVGIECQGSGMGPGNSIVGNKIVECSQPGLYLDVAPYTVVVKDNELWGNCTNSTTTTYGGNILNTQMYVSDKDYIIRRNIVRVGDSSVSYGILLWTAAGTNYLVDVRDNDVRGGGTVKDVATNSAGASPPSLAAQSYIGDLQKWEWQQADAQNNGTLDSAPSGANGWAVTTCGPEMGIYLVQSSASSTAVTLLTGTANAVATDTNAKSCFFASGDRAVFRNRSGATQPSSVMFYYR